MTTKGTTVDLPAKLTPAEKRQRRMYVDEGHKAIEGVNRSARDLGRALAALIEEHLYREDGLTFPEFVLAEFAISKSTAYRCIQVWEWSIANPTLPTPAQWQLEPGKVAKKNAPKTADRPTRGTVAPNQAPSDLPVLDAEGSEEVEIPAQVAIGVGSEALDTRSADSPGVTPASQPEVSDGLTASGGEAEQSSEAVAFREAQIRAMAAAYPPVEGVEVFKEALGDDFVGTEESSIDTLRRILDANPQPPAITALLAQYAIEHPPTLDDLVAGKGPIDLDALRDDTLTDEEYTDFIAAVYGEPTDPIQASIDALILLLQSADLEAMGAAMTADQIETFGLAYETARDAWAIANKPREKLSKGQRVKAGSPTAKVAPKAEGALARREVAPMFKASKEKVAK